ncbi:uroporphyrinogen-III synthase [Edaphobacter sp.]|uniref:uroporphyrinogen-III synthase n=1 Tax=Edaphobacter sp. TaxID=1934404 RepID=UPI002DBE589D|nr:uroporphyrinogen-III synthase [Edaphobacter sp.]HEU5342627.1 uroporphyrinogen-III synthase [Edaphobacter sp.]
MYPLAQRRILVTRTRHQASGLAAQLESLGATVVIVPTIEIVPPETYAPLDAALARLAAFDWLIFTSANAVEVFEQRRNRAIAPKRIAVIGPATARAVEEIGLAVDLIPPQYVGESLAVELTPYAQHCHMLLIRAAEARDTLPETLRAAGATVSVVAAYRNQVPPGAIPTLQSIFASPRTWPDAITFTSASTARNLFALLDAASLVLPEKIVLASIGPITSQTLRDLGHPPHVEAAEHTIPALVHALAERFA